MVRLHSHCKRLISAKFCHSSKTLSWKLLESTLVVYSNIVHSEKNPLFQFSGISIQNFKTSLKHQHCIGVFDIDSIAVSVFVVILVDFDKY